MDKHNYVYKLDNKSNRIFRFQNAPPSPRFYRQLIPYYRGKYQNRFPVPGIAVNGKINKNENHHRGIPAVTAGSPRSVLPCSSLRRTWIDCTKFKFSKILRGGALRAPSQTPPPLCLCPSGGNCFRRHVYGLHSLPHGTTSRLISVIQVSAAFQTKTNQDLGTSYLFI